MSDIFDDTISDVHEQKSAAAASETPDTSSEVIPSEGQSASPPADNVPDTQASDQTAEPQGAAGEGARDSAGTESQATTDTEITGHENVEELLKRDGVAAKFMRRTLPLIKQAGGMPLFRAGADIVSAGNDPSTSAEDFGKAIASAVGPSRWNELRDGIVGSALADPQMPPERFNALVKAGEPFIWRVVENSADVVVKGLLEDETATLAEVKEALADYRQWKGEGGQQEQPADPTDLSQLDPALRKEIEESRELRKRFPELEREVSTFRTERQTAAEQAKARQIDELGQELYSSIFSVVTERVNRLGLEPKPTDTPRIKGIKKSLRDALSQESLEAAFESNTDRKGLSEKAIRRVQALEREGAMAYRDPLAVMAEMTLGEVLESEEVKSLLEALKSETTAQSTPKDPSARDEIVQGAPAALNPADRWNRREEGEDFFDVGARLAREKVSAAR